MERFIFGSRGIGALRSSPPARLAAENWGVCFALALVFALGAAWGWGWLPRVETARCPSGLLSAGARCCAPGQHFAAGACVGKPTRCPYGFSLRAQGCVIAPTRIAIPGGTLRLGPNDWQAPHVRERELKMSPLLIDASEVTANAWSECVRTGTCAQKLAHSPLEPGQPVTHVTPSQAERFCLHQGGRLPTLAEWSWVASGPSAQRFPWGPTGLVCRRASFGLVSGPCSEGATTPELAGARPDGRTPAGVADLAGNVAEWALVEPGQYRALGGSFKSRVAAELLASAALEAHAPADTIGFRCVYPVVP